MQKRIAVLGWGSLVWRPESLGIKTKWRVEGPCLPVEFARKSGGMRVTLVLVEGYGQLSRVYWAMSAYQDVGGAAENLRVREGCPTLRPIHVADSENYRSAGDGTGPKDEFGSVVSQWVAANDQVDCAIWTGLGPKTFGPDSQRMPLDQQVIAFLRSLKPDEEAGAKEYVVNAPASIRTPVREAIEEELGWRAAVLDARLFDGSKPGEPCTPGTPASVAG